MIRSLTFLLLFFAVSVAARADSVITIGSKKFTESYILSEIMAQLLENGGYTVDRKFGMDSSIAFEALRHKEIDLYPDYTGTISRVYLKQNKKMSLDEIRTGIQEWQLDVLQPFGFNNTYAIAIPEKLAKEKNLNSIGDLRGSNLRGAVTFEFTKREDGWPGLNKAYNLGMAVTGMEHSLAYEALKNGKADFTDAYSTDAKLKRFGLITLADDREFFPKYFGLPFIRQELPAKARTLILQLSGLIDDRRMTELNAQAEYGGKNFSQIASEFLQSEGLVTTERAAEGFFHWPRLWKQTKRHLTLTFLAIALAVLVAVPTGILLYRNKSFAPPILMAAGLLQTIPSIALLAFMIPLFGIGLQPAVAALFLFSILPILRNTYAALDNIDQRLLEAARGIGLYPREIMAFVQLPLAVPIILAGIRTAAVINVGTATLAAFIGAGGLGESIVTGLALNDNKIVLQGAIPAALLAILIELGFEFVQKRIEAKVR